MEKLKNVFKSRYIKQEIAIKGEILKYFQKKVLELKQFSHYLALVL